MLNKNLYLIWPTGYYGTYLHWIINKSNPKTAAKTINNPFISTGSSHGHYKIPTHMSIESHLVGMIKNRYPVGTIYPIGLVTNVNYASDNFNWRKTFENVLFWIFKLESEPVIINIYNDNNDYHHKLAAINMYNKEHWELEYYPNAEGYYVFNDTNSLRARNYLVKNWKQYYPSHTKQATMHTLELYATATNENVELRRKYEGYEYDADTFKITATGKHLYNIKIGDFLKPNFIEIIEPILCESGLADFNFDHVKKMHQLYLRHQKKFIHIADVLYKQAVELNYYKDSEQNVLYSALAIDTLSEIHNFLPNNWEVLTIEEIIKSFKHEY